MNEPPDRKDSIGELGAALSQLDPLGGLLGHHLLQFGVHLRQLRDEGLVVGLDLLDLGLHRRDLLADLVEIGADFPELVLGVRDLGSKARLEVIDRRDLCLLLGDLLLERRAPGLRVGQLVAAGGIGRGGRAEQADHQWDQQGERRDVSTDAGRAARGGLVGPAGRSRPRVLGTVGSLGAADHEGDVIVRAGSVGRHHGRGTASGDGHTRRWVAASAGTAAERTP